MHPFLLNTGRGRGGASPTWLSRMRVPLGLGFVLILCAPTIAFPPAPHHLLYGTVRDEMGNPLSLVNAAVILETSDGVTITTEIVPSPDSDRNYRLRAPIDSGVTPDPYRSLAVNADVPFTMRVIIGSTVYLPIEMSGDFARLGEPAESTRLDLTLGEDSDGDGLPDAWERALSAASGGKLTEVDPDADSDNDGLSNLQEYRAGTFAYDDRDGLSLQMREIRGGSVSMEFMSIRGRTYKILGSANLKEWNPVPFRMSGDDDDLPDRESYRAENSSVVEISVAPSEEDAATQVRFFRLRVQ